MYHDCSINNSKGFQKFYSMWDPSINDLLVLGEESQKEEEEERQVKPEEGKESHQNSCNRSRYFFWII